MKPVILVDTHERNSIPILDEFFTIIPATLPTGDVMDKERQYCIELKIGNDVKDYTRLANECSRMEANNCENHAIYIQNTWDIEDYSQFLADLKIFYSHCQRYHVYAHHIYKLDRLPSLLKDIFSGNYA